MLRPAPSSTLFPYTTLFRSAGTILWSVLPRPDRFEAPGPLLTAEAHPRLFAAGRAPRSEEHTSELQSRLHLVCRLLLEKKKHGQPYMPAMTATAVSTNLRFV